MPAEENARELVAAVGVSAKKIDSLIRGRGAEEMQMRREEAEQAVACASDKEMKRNRRCRGLFELVEGAFSQTQRVEKWAEVEMALGIDHVKVHRGKVRAIAILLSGIIG